MKEPFRKIGECDSLCDSESQISSAVLANQSIWRTLFYTALPYIFIAISATAVVLPPKAHEYKIISAISFFLSIAAYVAYAIWVENKLKGFLVPLYAASHSRFAFFISPALFFAVVLSMPKEVVAIVCLIAIIGFLLQRKRADNGKTAASERENHPFKEFIFKGLWAIANVFAAFTFQFALLYQALLGLLRLFMYIGLAVVTRLQLFQERFGAGAWFQYGLIALYLGDTLNTKTYIVAATIIALFTPSSRGNKSPGDLIEPFAQNKPAVTPAVAGEVTHASAESEVDILHLTDLHLMSDDSTYGLEGMSRNSQTSQFLKSVSQTLAESVDLIAVTGDITDTGFSSEWHVADKVTEAFVFGDKSKLSQSKLAIVPGNHDINVSITYGTDVHRPNKYEKQLTLFGRGYFSPRENRLIRFLAYLDKWCGAEAHVYTEECIFSKGRLKKLGIYLGEFKDQFNKYCSGEESRRDDDICAQFDGAFPARISLDRKRVCVYMLDSNASTWHALTNAFGHLKIGQLWRLWNLLDFHPKGYGAVFLLHHHLKPGRVAEGTPNRPRKVIEQLFMTTLGTWLLSRVVAKLGIRCVLLHGHTHFARGYRWASHTVICGPSTTFGDASEATITSCIHRYRFSVDYKGNMELKGFKTLVP